MVEVMLSSNKVKLSASVLLVMAMVRITPSSQFEAERPYDPCITNPCETNCTCELDDNFGTNRYRCKDSKDKCTWSALEVKCNLDAIRVTLPAWLVTQYALKHNVTVDDITNALYISSRYRPNDKCKAFANTTTTGETLFSLVLSVPFTNCDTITRIEGGSPGANVLVSNQVWFEKTVANFYGYPVKLVNVSCSYQRKSIIGSLVKPVCCRPRAFQTKNGTVDVQVNLWAGPPPENEVMMSPLGLPLTYTIGEEIFVTIELTQDSEFNLTLLDCYVSPHFTVGKDFDSVDIIKDSCPSRSIHFRHDVVENGVGKRTLFMFQVFKLGDDADFYIHCHAELCAVNCEPQCTKSRTRRRRLSGNAGSPPGGNEKLILHQDFTAGPIHVARQRTAKKRKRNPMPLKPPKSDKAFSWMIPILLAFSNLTCVGLLGALCYALARSVSARRNHRLRANLRGTPVADLFLTRDQFNQSASTTEPVQLLGVHPPFDFARKCSMLTPPPSPSNDTVPKK